MLRYLVAQLVVIRRRRQAVELVAAVRKLIADIQAARADGTLSLEEIKTIAKDLFTFVTDVVGIF